MWERIKEKLLRFKDVIGLEVYIQADGQPVFNGVHLLANWRGEVRCVGSFEKVKDIKVLKENIPDNTPVALSINGKGLIVRNNLSGREINNPIVAIIPEANPNDFIYALHEIAEDNNYIYVTRKELLEEWISLLNGEGLLVVDAVIGTGTFDTLLPFLAAGVSRVETIGYTFNIGDRRLGEIHLFDRKEQIIFEEVFIGDRYYRSSLLPALANAFSILNTFIERPPANAEMALLSSNRKEYRHVRLFKMTGWTALLTLLTVLLINYFVFSYYFNKNKELSEIAANAEGLNKVVQMNNARIDSDYAFLVRSGWDKSLRHSYFVDHIAALVPETISLVGLQSAPLDDAADLHDFIFAPLKISVRGESYDPGDLDVFINSIKNLEGIRSVALSSYLYKKELKGAVFTIDIKKEP